MDDGSGKLVELPEQRCEVELPGIEPGSPDPVMGLLRA